MFHSSDQPPRRSTRAATPRGGTTARICVVASVAIALLLTLMPRLNAQEVYKPAPAATLMDNQIAQQLNSYPPHTPAHQGSPVRLKTAGSIVDSVSQVTREAASPRQQDWQQVVQSSSALGGRAATQTSRPASFIEREKASDPATRGSAQALITKISINLCFVLALAVGFVLFARQWQKSKTTLQPKAAAAGDSLCLRQSLTLTAGASLHIVEGFEHKFLVAMDASGIKSVKVLNPSFAEAFDQSETMPEASEAPATLPIAPEPRAAEAHDPDPIGNDQSSAEIDEKLIKLLLRSSHRAA
jgi:hypothetical protein